MGSKRYSEFQRALSKISPTLLAKRLNELETADIVFKQKIQGGRGYEYFLTKSGKDLGPLVITMARWGMQWAKSQLPDEEVDVELLMWDIQRRIDSQYFPNSKAVLKFNFTDIEAYDQWWIVVDGDNRDLCTENPGQDVNIYFTVDARTLIRVWSGELTIKQAQADYELKVVGDKKLIQSMRYWLMLSILLDNNS